MATDQSHEKLLELCSQYLGQKSEHILYAPDSGGYDIEGKVTLSITDKGIKMTFNRYGQLWHDEDDWIEEHSIELQVKEKPNGLE